MGRNPEEVSEEDSPVTILDPNDPKFRVPNVITARDFEGWVEQRGSKFWTTWDPRYKALLETHDTGQPPQKGGWLTARHGKGLLTEEQVQEAVERINHRPRKVLGFRTPHEVFFGVELCYTKQPLAVALRT